MTTNREEEGYRVRSPKIAELIAGDVRRRIILGELGVDETLPSEPDLMIQYGVSRNVLREALRILESESLIDLPRGARGGARVHAPEARVASRYFGLLLQWRGATLGDVVHAHVMLETAAVREVTLAANRADCTEELRRWIDEAAKGVDDFDRYGDLAWNFSKALVGMTGNKTIVLQHEMIEEMITAHIARVEARMRLDPVPGVRANALNVRAMQRLVQFIDQGDERLAEDYWRDHLIAATATLADGLDRGAVVDLVEDAALPRR
jgi:GntR family transcriptional regulator, transcriptional repressor for pyruvate dehydrogenase complex